MLFDPNILFAQTLDLVFERDEEAFNSASDFLAEAQRLLDAGAPFPEEYLFLEELSTLGKLPFTEVSERIEVGDLPLDGISDVAILLFVLARHENLSFKGALYSPRPFDMVDSYVIHFLDTAEGENGKMLNVQQYARPMEEGPLDIQDEITRWFSGENPRRQEMAEENAACQDRVNDEAESALDDVETLDFPALVLTLLSGNWLFFRDGEIVWNGTSHEIVGVQVNAAQAHDLMDFWNRYTEDFEDINEVLQYFIAFLREAEKDRGLVVPRACIAPGVCQALPEGPMTGITLANLAACGSAFMVGSVKGDTYNVFFDGRLSDGIPRFFDLVARLLWDLRQGLNSLKGQPFRIAFAQARSFDADQCLDTVDSPVSGAQENPILMKVSSCPEIVLFTGTSIGE